MTRMIRIAAYIFLATTFCGCGKFSNIVYFEGEGVVSGYVTVDGAPIEGALVFVLGEPENLLTTGQGGSFSLLAQAGETRHLVIVWGTNQGLKKKFSLAGDGRQELGDVELKALGVVEGTVVIADPQDAEVLVEGTPFVARPDWEGHFQLSLPAGSWNLVVSAPGQEDVLVADVTVESGETAETGSSAPEPDPDYTCDTTETRVERFNQGGGGAVDILFLLDNSGSMVGEQKALAYTFDKFVSSLEAGVVDYRIAVVTTGMESGGCPPCTDTITNACINETGETGRFQDRIGKNTCTEDDPCYTFEMSNPACRVVTRENLTCFYDQLDDSGTILAGINGCGYERGLSAMRSALRSDLLGSYNAGFLRPAARLAVIVVTDEEDCGEVGDVEEYTIDGGYICYFASKGVGPEGETSHPDDPLRRPYQLTPVEEYYQFLLDTKGGQNSLVKFAAIVGVNDASDPSTTTIEYDWNAGTSRWDIRDACTTPGCTGNYCFAEPGTRYIKMAQLTGGIVESICQLDFAEPMLRISGASTGYVRSFPLRADPTSPDKIEVFVNGVERTVGWAWDPAKKAVVFEEASAPPPYSLVRIAYETACR